MRTRLPKGLALAVLSLAVLGAAVYLGVRHTRGQWTGVDASVVEKFAEQAGHPATKPFINTDQGDLLLLVFLLAGTAGGFVLGYNYRNLFGPGPERQGNAPDA